VGGVAAALVSGLLYLPHIVITWGHEHHYALEQYAEIVMFFAVGILTGVLSGRERRRRAELQETAEKLRRVYQELQETSEQVKRADRLSVVGQLAAGLAHEIRNPLASIDGAAEVLDGTPESDDVRREIIGIIRKECFRLNRLLSSLLLFARPSPPERKAVDIGVVLDSTVDLLSHSAGREIRLKTEVDRPLPPVLLDREQITQVFLNLALNAAQAMPEGGDIVLSAREADGGVLVRVRDEGPGIPQQHLDRIFDPFFTTKETGTGLGLSVAHQIVTQHAGTIRVVRNADRGMTFEVFLPRFAGESR
jgi:two-component system, NtrC family, sensor histidine kinase HydH